ncbi:DUF6098 family protein [Streptomyces sp. NPDC003038]|uniref:DUF6098 family protein n=1 Tax=unclassified Streptomyces TaxID=2593676 RepID=UPI0033B28A38
MDGDAPLPTLRSLDEVAEQLTDTAQVYVRWSRGPHTDLGMASDTDSVSGRDSGRGSGTPSRTASSSDELTGTPLPGLSANPLAVEPWWGHRPVRIWVARRLHDYSHLPRLRGNDVRPWLLKGTEVGRGPDNEPLVSDVEPLAWIELSVIEEATREITRQPGRWGPIQRTP